MKIVKFTDEELQALVQLMDAGVRNIGLQAAQNASVLMVKLNQAEEAEVTTGDVREELECGDD